MQQLYYLTAIKRCETSVRTFLPGDTIVTAYPERYSAEHFHMQRKNQVAESKTRGYA